MKHAILGAGGVGGLIGARLAQTGDHVTLLLRPETAARHPGQLWLESPLGDVKVPVRLDTKLSERVDVLWIAVKAQGLVAALHAVPSDHLGIAAIVPLLNGIDHVAVLRSRFEREHVVPGTIAVESERVEAGHIIQRSPFARLALSAAAQPQLEGVAARLRDTGLSCEFQADEKTMLWGKLAFLAPFALVTTASDKGIQEILADRLGREQLESAIREVCAVAKAEGATVDLARVLATIESLPATMRSSMQKDVTAGRVPELDAIGGPIVRVGRSHGIDVTTTCQLIARIEGRLHR